MPYICLDCEAIFEEPRECTETHGLDSPPYEVYYVCPNCGGDFVTAYKCTHCNEYITDTYVKTEDGNRYCDACYMIMELGDED